MDHFKSLKLKNWLCYKNAIFKFSPGVNVIIGPSDHGKSAMMDALRKIITNKPMGDDFIRWNTSSSEISLKLQNHVIKYKKGKKAEYQVKDIKTNKVIIFKAFRSNVPDEIISLLQINRKINIQRQLEKNAPIFLLSEKPVEVARLLNEVANLQSIDIALTAGKESLNIDIKDKKIIDKSINKKEIELLKYAKLDDLKILVIHAEKIEKRIDFDSVLLDSLQNKVALLIDTKTDFKRIKTKLKIRPLVKSALKEIAKGQDIKISLISFKDDLEELKDTQKSLIEIRKKLKVSPLVKRCFNLTLIIDQYKSDLEEIEVQLLNLKLMVVKLKDIKRWIKDKKRIYKKEYPAICPFCNSKVKRDLL